MSSISRRIAVMMCSRPTGVTGVPGSVTSTASAGEPGVELRPLELGAAGLDGGLERLAGLVGRPPDRAALLRRELGDAAQQVRQLRLAAEVRDPRVLELGGAGRRGDRRGPLRLELLDPVPHARATLVTS